LEVKVTVKILTTIGPASLKKEVIRKLDNEAVSLFRINMSHTALSEVEKVITLLQSWSNIPVCLDTEGAQVRNQKMESDKVFFSKGSMVKIHHSEVLGDCENISLYPEQVAPKLEINDTLRVDFNSVVLKVKSKLDSYSLAEVVEEGYVGSNKAANVDRDMDLEPITNKDRLAIKIGLDYGIKDFSLSFTNSSNDVIEMRKLVGDNATIISKIESINGLLNLGSILNFTDSILIDRGDLSREVPIEKIPVLQRKIIQECVVSKVPVYVATNLLETMILAKNPSRAEVNDVASTVMMGADGLVLAAETAIGLHPVDSVKMVKSVVHEISNWHENDSFTDIINSQK
jgi:pyruvate kinase